MASHPLFKPVSLHIPDGMLSLPISAAAWVIAILILAAAVRKTRGELGERQAPLMGVMAAFIFAAQMINFAVIGGTSGHLLGGALAAVTLGPWAGMLVMTAVVIVQGLLFQDGGLLVMGANILNMGILTTTAGYGLFRLVSRRSRSVRLVGASAAAWLSVMAAALATSLQLWLSGVTVLRLVVPAMMGIHALIGIGEALITSAALAFILRTRPEVLAASTEEDRPGWGWALAGIALALGVVLLTPLASADPDGLERVAIDLGFMQSSQPAPYTVLPDYTLPFLGETPLSTILAGVLGVLVVAGLVLAVFSTSRRRKKGTV